MTAGTARRSVDVDDQRGASLLQAEVDEGRARTGDAVAVLPYQNKPVLPAAPARRRAFEAHLDEIVAAAFAGPPPRGDPAGARPNEGEPDALVIAGCAACQGMCCSAGGESLAYLARADIQRLRGCWPGATAGMVRAAYLGRIPDTSVLNACLFQSDAGCTLPRQMRSDICNGFRCRGLKRLAERLAEGRSAAVLATEFRGKIVAVARVTRDEADKNAD
jgi:hypothetical protein